MRRSLVFTCYFKKKYSLVSDLNWSASSIAPLGWAIQNLVYLNATECFNKEEQNVKFILYERFDFRFGAEFWLARFYTWELYFMTICGGDLNDVHCFFILQTIITSHYKHFALTIKASLRNTTIQSKQILAHS